MGINERREREKNERRTAILRCAKELILSQGVEHVSMEDIARRAELSKATVYLYFSGKEVLFNEICEESARVFIEHFKPLMEADLNGIEAMKYFWKGYVQMFGSSDDMIIVFQVHSYLDSSPHDFLLNEENGSPNVNVILETMRNIIDRCKADGFFDPALDSAMAARLLLSMFSSIVENASRIPLEARKSPAVVEEMTNAFQIIIRGFAREGIDRSCLDITCI